MNLYNVTKFSLYCSLLFISSTKKISGFTLVLPLRIIFDCFYLLVFYFENFSTSVCRKPDSKSPSFSIVCHLYTSPKPEKCLFLTTFFWRWTGGALETSELFKKWFLGIEICLFVCCCFFQC